MDWQSVWPTKRRGFRLQCGRPTDYVVAIVVLLLLSCLRIWPSGARIQVDTWSYRTDITFLCSLLLERYKSSSMVSNLVIHDHRHSRHHRHHVLRSYIYTPPALISLSQLVSLVVNLFSYYCIAWCVVVIGLLSLSFCRTTCCITCSMLEEVQA